MNTDFQPPIDLLRIHSRLALWLPALFALSLGTTSTAKGETPSLLGVNMHPLQSVYAPEDMPVQVCLARSLSVGIIRIDIHWAWIEPV